tara:strand:- start:3413 stop:4885 length:1473 start_codon:yes stop_codon:yes gene_type:complete
MKFLAIFIIFLNCAQAKTLKIGSKNFTESYILAEIVAQIAESVGEADVHRRFGLGGTGITFQALTKGEIHLYPEYTGTISESILKDSSLKDYKRLNEKLSRQGLTMSESLGFNNTYALAIKDSLLKEINLSKLSQLNTHNNIPAAFSHEFMKRGDGLVKLQRHYGFKLKDVKAMEHSLAYQALEDGKVDLVEVYSTDAKIEKYKLKILEDDLNFFPAYLSVLLASSKLKEEFPQTWQMLETRLVGKIDNKTMTKLNALVELDGLNFSQAARFFLEGKQVQNTLLPAWNWDRILLRTKEHLKLVVLSLVMAIIIGLPLGIIASQNKFVGQFLLSLNGVIQTIPSLALLCLLIPFFGIGPKPAIIALFLYALLPIVRGTHAGLVSIDIKLKESAQLMGLTKFQRLRFVLLPLASPSIMSGIKTSAIINVGTATLAAFIGAGGLGQIIVTGLALNDQDMILQGAIPAGALALIVHAGFELLDKFFVPVALRRN